MSYPPLWSEARCSAISWPGWDNRGCSQSGPGAFGVAEALKQTRERGWKVIEGDWVCPHCAKLRKEGKL